MSAMLSLKMVSGTLYDYSMFLFSSSSLMSAMLSLKMVSGTPYNINYVSIFLLDVSRAQLLDGLWYSLRLQYVFIFLFLLNV